MWKFWNVSLDYDCVHSYLELSSLEIKETYSKINQFKRPTGKDSIMNIQSFLPL